MTYGILGNTAKPGIVDVCRNLFAYLISRKIPFVVHESLGKWYARSKARPALRRSLMVRESDLPRRCDMLIALGGDGTMLAAARLIGEQEKPILGVNLGKLGFLAEVSVGELQKCLDDIARGKYSVEERMVLSMRSSGDARVYHALNEVVIDRGSSPRVIDLETYVDDDYVVTYAADGIIVTTPTGSTAYSLASGGPIVAPPSRVMVVNPISPHTLTARPVIVPDGSAVRVLVPEGPKRVHVTADGQEEGFYATPAEFVIRKAPYTVRLVKRKGRTYFDLLRTKLLWGRDVRIGRIKRR